MAALEAAVAPSIPTTGTIERVAVITVHTSPLSALGGPDAGGLTVYVMALAEQLASLGVQIDIFTRRFDPNTPEITEVRDGVRVISVSAGPPERVPKDDLFCYLADFASQMATFALRNGLRYDAIHTHYWLSGWVGHLLKRYWDAPIIHMYHTLGHLKNAVSSNGHSESGLRLQVERELLQLVDYIVVPNPDERAELVWGLGARNAKIATIPPGIDLELFHPSDPGEARRELGLPDRPIILFVGRLDPIKDLDTLLQAYGHLRKNHTFDGPPPALLIIGGALENTDASSTPDTDLQRIAARAQELGIDEGLILPGSQPQQILPKYYAASTVLAMPSLYESFGLAVVEAMACGLPVVATRVGGMKFTVEEQRSGLLVPRQEPEAMADALYRVISDRDFRATLQIGARQAAIRFSWHTIGSAILTLSERLAHGEREPQICYSAAFRSS